MLNLLQDLMEWWKERSPWVRYPVAVGLLAVASGWLMLGEAVPLKFVAGLYVTGLALLWVSPSDQP